jgi:hypothetical protein
MCHCHQYCNHILFANLSDLSNRQTAPEPSKEDDDQRHVPEEVLERSTERCQNLNSVERELKSRESED